jgi:hypothetical protein
MRYLRQYDDDTLSPYSSHVSGELVNRKPLDISFIQKKHVGKRNGRQAGATKLGKSFLKKLDRLGL